MKRFAGKLVARCAATFGLLAASLALGAGPALAQDYPTKPITLVYPFPAGVGGDAAIRVMADEMSKVLGQSIVVINKPGGSGMLGYQTLKESPPDGYTLSFFHNGLSVIRRIADPAFTGEPETDYAPIAVAWEGVSRIAANPDAPFKDIAGFVEYARANPGELTVAMGGMGSTDHISAIKLMQAADIEFNLVSYTGSGNAILAAVSGEVMAVIASTPMPAQIEAGQLVPISLAVTERSPMEPDWPALSDAGIQGYQGLNNWMGFYAPAGTPPEVIEKLNAAIIEAFSNEEVHRKVAAAAGVFSPSQPAELTERIHREIELARPVVEEIGIKF